MTTADVNLITAEVAVLKSQMDDVKSDVAEVKGDVKKMRDEVAAFKGGMRVALWLLGVSQAIVVGVAVAVLIRLING